MIKCFLVKVGLRKDFFRWRRKTRGEGRGGEEQREGMGSRGGRVSGGAATVKHKETLTTRSSSLASLFSASSAFERFLVAREQWNH